MKTLYNVLVITLIISLTGCSEGLLTEPDQVHEGSNIIVNNELLENTIVEIENPDECEYPQSTSFTVQFHKEKNIYKGAKGRLKNGSVFRIKAGDLTPPKNHPWGKPVTITMKAELDTTTQELIFSFGPSGCRFDKPATLWFKWADLGSPNADLYYIDKDGSYLEHLPDNIDVKNKRMCLYIDHFSRYALAYSD